MNFSGLVSNALAALALAVLASALDIPGCNKRKCHNGFGTASTSSAVVRVGRWGEKGVQHRDLITTGMLMEYFQTCQLDLGDGEVF